MKDSYFIDSHCHIDMYDNIEEIVNKARKNNVNIIINQGVDHKTNVKTLELSAKYSEIKAALGLFPIDALKLSDKEIDSELEFIKKNKESVIAIGEVGLDYKEDAKDHEKQKKVLSKFINLARVLKKPIFIHSRKAELDCIELLEKLKAEKVIMHCFSGKLSLVKRIIENKWFLTIPTNVVSSEHFQKVIALAPIDQLLCETDSPFLHPFKEKNNEPSFIVESYKKIAEIKSLNLEQVRDKIFTNYQNLFSDSSD